MKHRTFFSLVLATLAITGCNSLNVNQVTIHQWEAKTTTHSTEIELTPAAPVEEPAAPSAPEIKKEKPAPTIKICPLYRPPTLPAIPALPIKELEALGAQGGEKVTEIERKHIADLRTHAIKVKDLIERSYRKYLSDCRVYLRKHDS